MSSKGFRCSFFFIGFPIFQSVILLVSFFNVYGGLSKATSCTLENGSQYDEK